VNTGDSSVSSSRADGVNKRANCRQANGGHERTSSWRLYAFCGARLGGRIRLLRPSSPNSKPFGRWLIVRVAFRPDRLDQVAGSSARSQQQLSNSNMA
jgi:hypothetical protein